MKTIREKLQEERDKLELSLLKNARMAQALLRIENIVTNYDCDYKDIAKETRAILIRHINKGLGQ